MSDLMFRPADELASLVRSGELTATELVETSLRRIDELQPAINAFTYVADESALAAASEIGPGDSRPFAGVPIAIKDNEPVAGMPLTFCSDLFQNVVPDHDAFFVRRLRDAGFVIVGKTSLPEMGIMPTTEPRRFGAARNPWNTAHTTGGSSGGSAAAVAAGMVPIAHGNDGGGSIRIPAACCGLVGLKAARGRVSPGPDVGQSFLTIDGVLTHTVRETAQLLDILAGYELGDMNWAPPGPRDGLRVAGPTRPRAAEDRADARAAAPRRRARSRLRARGPRLRGAARVARPRGGRGDAAMEPQASAARLHAPVRSGRLDRDDDRSAAGRTRADAGGRRAADMGALAACARARCDELPGGCGAARVRGSRDHHRARSIRRDSHPGARTAAGADRRDQWARGRAGSDPYAGYRRSGYFTPYTGIVNITGLPAISLPLYHGEDGLPTAVQLIGSPAREEVLLQLAGQLESAQPWAQRRPPVDELVAAAGA